MGGCGSVCCNSKAILPNQNLELETFNPMDENTAYIKFTD
jgi:hypothetical protein